MNAEDQEFAKLQRLLKLKRHEQPPPRYFNEFSSRVTARLRAGDRGNKHETDESSAPVWLQRLWRALEAKPAASGVFAAGVCGLVLVGIMMTDSPTGVATEPPLFGVTQASPTTAPVSGNTEYSSEIFSPTVATTSLANDTNPTLPSLFTAPALQTVPVSGTPLPR